MFKDRWVSTVNLKKSQLCIGLDPVQHGQLNESPLSSGVNKVNWCCEYIEQVGSFASALKINRNFILDLCEAETLEIVKTAKSQNLLVVDDAKLADIGSSNHAGLYHAKRQGYDAVTISPYAGNIPETAAQAKELEIDIITVILMSAPSFQKPKQAILDGRFLWQHFLDQTIASDCAGIVIGAPSSSNSLSELEISTAAKELTNQVVLVPGIGAQGGQTEFMKNTFGKNAIFNVGRAIMNSKNPAETAKLYRFHNEASFEKSA